MWGLTPLDPLPSSLTHVGAFAFRRHQLFFICDPGLTEHARERGWACDHAALRRKGGGQFGHGDVRLGFNAPDQKSPAGRQLPAPARAPPMGRLNRPCSLSPLEKLV